MAAAQVTVVDACTREGRGGSPTTVVIDEATLTDDERRAIASTAGTSHTAFIDTGTADAPAVRFFTTEGELKNCGHGTIAAQAVLLHRSGATRQHGRQRTGAAPDGIIAALGLTPGAVIADDLRVASPGTPRLLVPVRERRTLPSMRPDFARLGAECRRLGYLGCFTYALSPTARTAAARMFAPAIGVDEDIVNANSAGCLAAHLLGTSRNGDIEVHQGDTFGSPSSVLATATQTRDGIAARIGGWAHCRPRDGGRRATTERPRRPSIPPR